MKAWLTTHYRALAWFALLALIVIFYSVLFSARRVELTADSGLAEPVPDAWLFYTPDRLVEALPHYTPAGRQGYARSEFTLDLAFPLIYGAWFYLGLASLSGALLPAGSPWRRLRFAPLVMIAADLTENSLLTAIMLSFPPANAELITLVAVVSALKWLLGLVCAALLAVGALVWLVRAVSHRRT